MNVTNFIRVISLFVIMVWLMNDTPDSLMADTTVNARVEYTIKYSIHRFSPIVSAGRERCAQGFGGET